MQTYTHKRGATFSLAGSASLPAGVWTATAQIKRGASVIAAPSVTLGEAVNGATPIALTLADSTATWPLTELSCDIRFTDGTNVLYSPTFIIDVAQEVTSG